MLPCPALRWHVCTHSRSEGFTRRLFATEPSGLRATAKGFSNKQGQPCVEPVEQDELCFDCEDVEVAHSAFLTAHRHSRPENVQVEGMQDFAAAIWDRRRSIPAAGDPLMRIFEAFDSDHDGRLNAKDVTAALRSRNVQITEDQAQLFIEAADIDSNHTVERNEFRSLITHMASADLWSRQLTEAASKSSSSESESEAESEEEVAQNEILQSILLESYEEVVIKQKQSESDG